MPFDQAIDAFKHDQSIFAALKCADCDLRFDSGKPAERHERNEHLPEQYSNTKIADIEGGDLDAHWTLIEESAPMPGGD